MYYVQLEAFQELMLLLCLLPLFDAHVPYSLTVSCECMDDVLEHWVIHYSSSNISSGVSRYFVRNCILYILVVCYVFAVSVHVLLHCPIFCGLQTIQWLVDAHTFSNGHIHCPY